jgi:MYXO-CTERM domain-containing protein
MLLEDQGLLIGSGKGVFGPGGSTLSNDVYVANSNDFGHQHAVDNNQLVQSISTAMPVKYGWSGMATFPGPEGPQLFLCGAGMPLTSYQLSGGQFSQATPNQIVVAPPNREGAPMSISTSGPDAGPGVLWLLMALTDGDGNFEDPTGGVLRAFSTADVTTELWDSNLNSARDSVGNVAKFTTPTIANGRVFAGTFAGVVDVYGLLPDGGGEAEADGGDGGETAEDAGDSGVSMDGGEDGGDAGNDAGPDAGDAGLDSGPHGTTSSSSSSSTGGSPPSSPRGGCSCSSPGATLWWWAAVPLAAILLRRRRER